MNVFQAVKEAIKTRDAAEFYGLKVNSSGMAICPFHNDHDPSMKVDQRFHCFGCRADGDVIDFTARLFNLNRREAAIQLAKDFDIAYEEGIIYHKSKESRAEKEWKIQQKVKETELNVYRIYCQYLHLLEKWKLEYAPVNREEEWDERYTEALRKEGYIKDILDTLENGTETERLELIKTHGKEIKAIEQRVLGCAI